MKIMNIKPPLTMGWLQKLLFLNLKKRGLKLRVFNSNPKFLSIDLKTNWDKINNLVRSDIAVLLTRQIKPKIKGKNH